MFSAVTGSKKYSAVSASCVLELVCCLYMLIRRMRRINKLVWDAGKLDKIDLNRGTSNQQEKEQFKLLI